jgi:hypothetical protein
MKLAIAAVALSTLYASTAFADTKLTTQGLLDNVCVAGRLDEKRLGPDIQHVAEAMNMRSQALPAEALPTINPDATSAWGLAGGDQTFIFAFARKKIDGAESKSCSVSSPASDEDTAAIRTFIETKYKVTKIADQEQGSSTITVYRAELLGFDKTKYFSIQRVHPGGGIDGMVMVSFFDGAP